VTVSVAGGIVGAEDGTVSASGGIVSIGTVCGTVSAAGGILISEYCRWYCE